MIAATAILLALVLGLAVGGKVQRLGRTSIRNEWVLLSLMVLQSLARLSVQGEYLAREWTVSLWGAIGVGLLVAMWPMRHRPGFALMALGVTANLAVTLANESMPVVTTATDWPSNFYRPATQGDVLLVLADVLPVGDVARVSLGDILLALGLLTFVLDAMTSESDDLGEFTRDSAGG